MKFNISDWVQGKTKDGELIHGFVETIDILQGFVTVSVVKSDNVEVIGKTVAVRSSWLKNVSEITINDAQVFQNAIDLALDTWDEAWFMELTNAKKASEEAAEAGERSKVYSFPVNRLGQSA
ncbi:hypothetical protein BK120_16050 [Paenibacillus sp. FSL A5-0031]|uniref:IDEAL domain-containing protein n=1 Tax=unclassified Paenibacillus TaxID=185978 RepID=UPI00096D169D|nr:IDEAL domain-containing protein [Paenibacillus sp. FSL A5-0031]OME82180.1 hypothetical protein BK120_16050 [Paenibacillus sp. FSL A5-0031]